MPPINVYQNCPCGSGKKIKFCCQPVIDDMLKIVDLLARHHHEMATQALVQLEKRVACLAAWTRAWVTTQRAMLEILPVAQKAIHFNQVPSAGQIDRLRETDERLAALLEELPNHGDLLALRALIELAIEPGPTVMRQIGRAFRAREVRNWPTHRILAETVATWCLRHGHPLAAGAHWRLAEQCDPAEGPPETLRQFEADSSIPPPLRSPYSLANYPADAALAPTFEAATALARQGAFGEAARAFGAVARQERANAAAWWNIALCHAFAGEDRLASQAFKAAAANQDDFEAAVESLILAALLREPSGQSPYEELRRYFRVRSVARLLSLLDEHPRAVRTHESTGTDEVAGSTLYQLLDKPRSCSSKEWQSTSDVPFVLGKFNILDARPNTQDAAIAVLVAFSTEEFEQCEALLREVAGDELSEPTERKTMARFDADEHLALSSWWLPPELIEGGGARQLYRQLWQEAIDARWMHAPLEILDGRTPERARGVPELARPLAAAVGLLEARLLMRYFQVDVDGLRQRLLLPPRAAWHYDGKSEAPLPNALQLRRISRSDIEALDLPQLENLLRHSSRLADNAAVALVLAELLTRNMPHDSQVDVDALLVLANQLLILNRAEEALDWLARGRQRCKELAAPIELMLQVDLKELLLRLDCDPHDRAVAELASRLWNYYLPKLPELRGVLLQVMGRVPASGPWSGASPEEPVLSGAVTVGQPAAGIWTPEAHEASPPAQLWLPGQP